MREISLSPRLAAVASGVRAGSRVADVGTDHGYIPAWLLQRGVCSFAVATDIHAAPLEKAVQTAREAGVEDKMRFLCTDGLEGVQPEEADTVVIAGMGGETIAGILERAPWTRQGTCLLLQPMSKTEQLRRWLYENGYWISEERLIRDGGKLYCLLTAQGGTIEKLPEPWELLVSPLLAEDPLYGEYMDIQLSKLRHACDGLGKAVRAENRARLDQLESILGELNRIKEEYDNGCSH